jgi:hypothetical protein
MSSSLPELTGRTDDRGNPVRVLSAAAAADWPMSGDARMSMLAARMQAASVPSRWPRIALAALALAAVVTVVTVSKIFFPSFPGWVRTVALMIVLLGAASLTGHVRKRLASAALARLLIEEGLCPACGYNFFGLVADAQDLLQCPECGAAWRAERVRRSEPFASGANMADANTVVTVANAAWTGKDDRAIRRPYVHPRLRREIKAAGDESIRARLAIARAEISRTGWLLRWSVAALLLLSAGGMAAAILIWGRPGMASQLAGLVPVLLFAGLGLWALFGNFCYSIRKVKLAMLRQNLCPSCAASLDGLTPEPDGRTVCSACLGAWQKPLEASGHGPPPLSPPPANTTVP